MTQKRHPALYSRRSPAMLAPLAALIAVLTLTGGPARAASCSGSAAGDTTDERQLLFGDLHVHTAWSLDAYAFGATATPRDAYAFARGQSLRLANGKLVAIDRPLDFAAVTDHAETWEITWSCTDPAYSDIPYCRKLRDLQSAGNGLDIFVGFLLPVVSAVPPTPAPFCDTLDCPGATRSQWRRMLFAANEANEPCTFSALIGYEWTSTPGGRHWHRNVIFRSDAVPERPYDYVRYPTAAALWTALAKGCRPEDGCDALAIPHNINWSDGGTFDVENDSAEVAALRTRYERLAEIHQEKGASECLPESPVGESPDCDFELLRVNSAKHRLSGPDSDPEAAWRTMRTGYYRSLLARGLLAYEDSGRTRNPLQLGAIGSTDGHFGAAGFTDEASFTGGVAAIWSDDETLLANPLYNPGGLVAVWAEENTRAAIFDALKRREAYATSGTRIRLRFGTSAPGACDQAEVAFENPMGSTLTEPGMRTFTVQAARDQTPLYAVEIVKATLVNGEPVETVRRIAEHPEGRNSLCVTWTDAADSTSPAYWYARVIEQESPRWSKHLCERLGNCDRFPDADRMIRERAWSSPIWYLPGSK